MDPCDGLARLALGRDDLTQIHVPDALDDEIGALRHLEDRHHMTLDELGFGVVQVVVVGIDRQHDSPGAASRFA